VTPVQDDTSVGMILQVLNGDRHAWERFSVHCQQVILSWCRSKMLTDADLDDIVQESMLVVLTKIHEFRRTGTGSLRAWLRAIAWRCRCEAIAKSRSLERLKETQNFYRSATEDIELLERQFDRLHEMESLERCLTAVRQRVQAATWSAFQKHALEKVPGAEVSRELGISLESVYAAKWRVLRLLRIEWRKITGQKLSLSSEFWEKDEEGQ
jgi:RNA polymerase sigma factor (sigma-70 family)